MGAEINLEDLEILCVPNAMAVREGHLCIARIAKTGEPSQQDVMFVASAILLMPALIKLAVHTQHFWELEQPISRAMREALNEIESAAELIDTVEE